MNYLFNILNITITNKLNVFYLFSFWKLRENALRHIDFMIYSMIGDNVRTKVFKSIDEQLDILKNRGLVIEDEFFTKDVLLRENYFFIMGYRHIFLEQNNSRSFIKNTTFNELYSLFQFDRFFRNIIFKNILIVENNYKSIFSYVLSKNYGYKERDYLNIKNFSQDPSKQNQINDLIRKLKRQYRVNGKQHSATKHYMTNYGYIPFWIGIKVISFGLMSELYSILKYEDAKNISEIYNIDVETLEVYLPILANYRNLCAHEDILFDHFTQKIIPDNKYHKLLNIEIKDNEYINGKNDIFALIIILKHLLSKDDFKMMMNEINYEIDRLNGKIKTISIDKVLKKMGFPVNYKEIMYLD